MFARRFLIGFLSLCLSIQFGVAQATTSLATPTISGTTVLTVPLESLYTDFVEATSSYTSAFTTDGATYTGTFDALYAGGLQATDVAVAPGFIINNFTNQEYSLCWFPVSGNWARLPRILFYGTIVFALIAREYEWLVAGALAASLTFSGVAAIQISLQVWTRQMMAELDLFATLGILSTSCIIAIPLMNWSSTIRYLGLSEEEKAIRMASYNKSVAGYEDHNLHRQQSDTDKPKDPAPTRTLIIFWGLLVSVGFFSAFAGFVELRAGADYTGLFAYAGANTVHCVPDGGLLNLTAGQFPHWTEFWFNQEFMTINNCENPCSSLPPGNQTLFRSSADLAILSAKEIDNLLEGTAISNREQRAILFTNFYFSYMLFGLPYIVAQGLMQLFLFRKHTPQQARHLVYVGLARGRFLGFISDRIRGGIAFAIALLLYFLMLLVLVLTPFVLVLNVAAVEIFLYLVPQAEDNKHVGQWGVMVGTALVLVAAFVCQFESGVRTYFNRAKRDTRKAIRHQMKNSRHDKYDEEKINMGTTRPGQLRRKTSYKPDKTFFVDLWHAFRDVLLDGFESIWHWVSNFAGIFGHEWRLFVEFWKNPDERPTFRQRRERGMSRRQQAKAHASDHQLKPAELVSMKSPQFEDYSAGNQQYSQIKNHGVETRIHPALSDDPERPILTHAPSSGHQISAWGGRSKALSHKRDSDRQTPATTPPPPLRTRKDSQHRKAVPLQSSAAKAIPHSHLTEPSPIQPSPTNHSWPNPHASNQGQIHTENQDHLSPDLNHRLNRDSSTVIASLNDSIADRSRRSNIYVPSPELESEGDYLLPNSAEDHPSPRSHAILHNQARSQGRTQPQHLISPRSHEGLIPVSSEHEQEQDAVPPLPSPKNTNHTHAQDQGKTNNPASTTISATLPQLSSRTSHLFSEDELARLYRSGTPQIRSLMPSRNSIAVPTTALNNRSTTTAGSGSGSGSGSAAGIAGVSTPGKVSYLQIQMGADFSDAENWGDQVVLRRDRYGRWVVVDAGEGDEEGENEIKQMAGEGFVGEGLG